MTSRPRRAVIRTKFYLGSAMPHWLSTAGVPLFISHRRLAGRKSLPRAAETWALDSGGYSELSLFGKWRTTPAQYCQAVRRYDQEIGLLEFAAPMDWMTEDHMLARTGLTALEHQKRTVANFIELSELWDHTESDNPFIPVLQGTSADDYARCVELYEDSGVHLADYPLVGVGSVCRRTKASDIDVILNRLHDIDPEMPLHGFGLKGQALRRCAPLLASADSQAWAMRARYGDPLPGHTHRKCTNCLEFALRWRARFVGADFCRVHRSNRCGCTW